MMYRLAVVLVLWPLVATMASFPGSHPAREMPMMKPTGPDTLSERVDAARPGETLRVRVDCIYREQVTISKPLTLDGQGGAEIRGSDVWDDWTRTGTTWKSVLQVPGMPSQGSCAKESDGRCAWPEQVFIDGVALRQVAAGAALATGEFSLSPSRQIIIADDPERAIVEVTTRPRWLFIQADRVTVRGFTMKHASIDAQFGALQLQNVSDWTIQGNTLSNAHGAVVSMINAPHGRLLDNEIFNAGQLGIHGPSANDVLIYRNVVHNNNTEQFSSGWEAGGVKITRTRGVVISENRVFMNNGPGIWCDIDCVGITINDNAVYGNLGIGNFFEISDGADIAGNAVWENGWGSASRGWVYEAGILVSSSSNANVHDNIVAWNGDGVAVISQCRAYLTDGTTCDLAHRWNRVDGNQVSHNVIAMDEDPIAPYNIVSLSWATDMEDANGDPFNFMCSPEARTRGYRNYYWLTLPETETRVRFSWGEVVTARLGAFNRTPGEEDGVYLGVDEKNRILRDAGIPVMPANHTAPVPPHGPLPPMRSDSEGARGLGVTMPDSARWLTRSVATGIRVPSAMPRRAVLAPERRSP